MRPGLPPLAFDFLPLALGLGGLALLFLLFVAVVAVAAVFLLKGKKGGSAPGKLSDSASGSPLVAHIEAARQELMHSKGVQAINGIVEGMYPTLKEKADAGPQAKP